MSIRTRLLLLVFAFVAPLLAAMAWFARDAFQAEEAAARANLRTLANLAAEDLQNGASGGLQLLSGLSQAPELTGADVAACSTLLRQKYAEFPDYTGILTFDPDGNLRCDALGTLKPQNFSNRPYFIKSRETGKPVIGAPVFGRLTGKAVLPILYPFRDASKNVAGYLYASYDLQKYAAAMRMKLNEAAVFAVWGANTTLMARYPEIPGQVGKAMADSPMARLIATGGDHGIAEFVDLDGVNRVFAVAKNPADQSGETWVSVSLAKDEVAALAHGTTRTLIYGAFSGLAVALIAALLFSEYVIRRPAKRLLEMGRRLASSDLSARIGAPYPGGELGELMRAADRIAEEGERQHNALKELNVQLDQRVTERTAELLAVNRELEAFAYSISHDLRSPLRHVQGFAAALADENGAALNEEGHRYLSRIHTATDRMGALIDGLLKLSRVTRSEIEREEVDVTFLATRILTDLKRSYPLHKVEWTVKPGIVLRADANLMDILLQNLLSNAWKFTAGKEPPVIEVGTMLQNGELVCLVRDNGVGFDPAFKEKLFQPFQRLHLESEFPGTGIGLATVQRIISRLGGRVWIEGNPGMGATVYFSLSGTTT